MANENGNGLSKMDRKSIHVKGVLTDEARQFADKQFAEAEEVSKEMAKRIKESRRLTKDDMAFRCNTIE
jgi:hypothetical protein